jgi:hypothetical protein
MYNTPCDRAPGSQNSFEHNGVTDYKQIYHKTYTKVISMQPAIVAPDLITNLHEQDHLRFVPRL